MSKSSIWPRNRTLSGTITQSQSEPENNGIPQSSSNSRVSPSDCLEPYGIKQWSKIRHYREKIDNKVIQAEGEIYWETKSSLQRFGSDESSLGLGGMIIVMLNQRWMFKKLYKKPREYLYIREREKEKRREREFYLTHR